jgi:signal recognition particle subunit SRP54
MGDVLSLIEKAEREYDEEVAGQALERLQSGRFTLDDFLDQLRQIKKMGPLTGLLSMMPGIPKEMRDAKVDERDVGKVEAIICSMTPLERADPTVLDGSRRLRIARGSGTSTTEVNNLLRQFKEMQKMIRGVGPMSKLAGAGRPGNKAKSAKGGRKKLKGGRVTPSSKGLGPPR